MSQGSKQEKHAAAQGTTTKAARKGKRILLVHKHTFIPFTSNYDMVELGTYKGPVEPGCKLDNFVEDMSVSTLTANLTMIYY